MVTLFFVSYLVDMSTIETIIRQQYDQMAQRYDQRWSNYISNTLNFLQPWAEIAPTDKVLDVACGTGEFERLILSENSAQHIVGVDLSERMLTIAQQKLQAYPNVTFVQASAATLPFSDRSFDVIVSANAFHYFENPWTALSEMKRVLKPNGKIVILDWCKDYFFCRLCDLLLKVNDPAYQQCYTQAEFHYFLTTSGFEITRTTKIRLGLVWGLMGTTVSPNKPLG
ncbi:MAG: class I SAM-dependent methyltransferase [Leptolyngbya sp. Prado105]|nr:class I SAM-dependent methyltransferase [Leptolyngbya sp. Prado105]